jgi:hypothetical protein
MRTVSRFLFVPLTILLVLVNAELLMLCSANIRLPGVAQGQFLHYSIDMTATGNDTELLTHTPQSQSAWGNVTVLSVLDVNVTFQQAFYNATTRQSYIIRQNIEDGELNYSVSLFPISFLAANLSAGDPTYTGTGKPYLNETVSAYYLGQQLETNHLMTGHNETNTYSYGYLVNSTLTAKVYWERRTGIMLYYHIEQDLSRPDGAGGVLTTHWLFRELILSAVPPPPVIPEFPSLLLLTLFMLTTLPAVIAFRKRRSAYTNKQQTNS